MSENTTDIILDDTDPRVVRGLNRLLDDLGLVDRIDNEQIVQHAKDTIACEIDDMEAERFDGMN